MGGYPRRDWGWGRAGVFPRGFLQGRILFCGGFIAFVTWAEGKVPRGVFIVLSARRVLSILQRFGGACKRGCNVRRLTLFNSTTHKRRQRKDSVSMYIGLGGAEFHVCVAVGRRLRRAFRAGISLLALRRGVHRLFQRGVGQSTVCIWAQACQPCPVYERPGYLCCKVSRANKTLW